MKRYTPDLNCLTAEFKRLAPCGDAAMMEHVTGSWVTHEDHLAAMEEQKTSLQCVINTESNKVKVLEELVALLKEQLSDVDVVKCWSCDIIIGKSVVSDHDGYCPNCNQPIDLDN